VFADSAYRSADLPPVPRGDGSVSSARRSTL
jgi:hypothetical protein